MKQNIGQEVLIYEDWANPLVEVHTTTLKQKSKKVSYKGNDGSFLYSTKTTVLDRGSVVFINKYETIKEFSTPEMKVFMYIVTHLRFEKLYIQMYKTVVPDKASISERTLKDGLAGLTAKGVIQRRSLKYSTYWVNPHFCYSGSRKRLVEILDELSIPHNFPTLEI